MNRDSFDRWAREHAGAMYRLALRLAASPADAEDLVQETFLRAWRGIGRFRGDSGLKTWLYRILLNTSHKLRRRRPTPIADLQPEAPSPAAGTRLERREILGRVLGAVHALPRRQREALLLRAASGFTYAQIADVMRIRRTAVKSHLVIARRKLLKRFGREAEEWGLK